MKFITVEQYLKADTKVQQAILEWWKPSVGDLVYDLDNLIDVVVPNLCIGDYKMDLDKSKVIPLLTEGQLSEFIENKLGGKIDIGYYQNDNNGCKGYTVGVWSSEPYECVKEIEDLGVDLLQALWQVVNQIIKEGGLFSFPRRKMS